MGVQFKIIYRGYTVGWMAGTLLGTVGPKWVNSYPPVARGCNDISPVGGLQTDNL